MFLLLATLIFHNATLFEPSGTMKPGVDVVIAADGTRVHPTRNCQHPEQAEVIDATGKYLLPGFVDMHAHLLEHGRDEKGEIPPRIDWDLTRRSLRLLLAHGVTTVRDPGSETEAAVTLRRMVDEGKIEGPRILTAGRIINASSFNPEPFQPVRNAEETRREIRWQAAAGVDFIKVYASMPADLVRVAIEEAHARRLRIIGHLGRTTWTEAAEMGIDFIAHAAPWSSDLLEESKRAAYDGSLFARVFWLENIDLQSIAMQKMVRSLVRHKVVVDPTLIAMHTKFFGNDPRWLHNRDNSLMPPSLVAGWKAGSFTRDWTAEQYAAARKAWPIMLRFTKLLYDAGIRLTVGTDMPTAWIVPGASVHEEMELLVSAGIPAGEVLLMATYRAYQALDREPQDYVLLSANPMNDIRNTRRVEAVVVRGELYQPKELLP